MVGGGVAVLLAAGAAIAGAVNDSHSFLSANLRPAVLDSAVWCWQDAAAKARAATSESRRDEIVVRTAILGAEKSEAEHRDSGWIEGMIETTRRIDRDSNRLGYIYKLFWSRTDRLRLFDHVARGRSICSANFGPFTRSAG